jgi:hypothetical protein
MELHTMQFFPSSSPFLSLKHKIPERYAHKTFGVYQTPPHRHITGSTVCVVSVTQILWRCLEKPRIYTVLIITIIRKCCFAAGQDSYRPIHDSNKSLSCIGLSHTIDGVRGQIANK